jgi:hypothetical protein
MREPLITDLTRLISVAGGQTSTSHFSLTSRSIPARRRGSFNMAVVPFIFQLPATSGRGPEFAILTTPTP